MTPLHERKCGRQKGEIPEMPDVAILVLFAPHRPDWELLPINVFLIFGCKLPHSYMWLVLALQPQPLPVPRTESHLS